MENIKVSEKAALLVKNLQESSIFLEEKSEIADAYTIIELLEADCNQTASDEGLSHKDAGKLRTILHLYTELINALHETQP